MRLPHHPVPDPALPGQESVWDYPRPAVAEPVTNHLLARFAGRTIAETRRGVRVIETSHPPSYYFPPADVDLDFLMRTSRVSLCEWKGGGVYYDVVVGAQRAFGAAWSYPSPSAAFRLIAGHIAFYAGAMEDCRIDGERVQAQAGGVANHFYGGWITDKLAGPFKGGHGTLDW